MQPILFSPLKIRELTIRNRIFVSPMCQYSAVEGVPQDWHMVHLGGRAVGGAGLVMAEATSVSPIGRISPDDTGLWNDAQVRAFKPITDFIKQQGAVSAVQLAHAGRKASTAAPWNGGKPLMEEDGGWKTIAPSAISFAAGYPTPQEMSSSDIDNVCAEFEVATKNALAAGFEVVEIHAAHGYLLHQFLSPLSNRRLDEYGGDLDKRMHLPLRISKIVRDIWPSHWPVFLRLSATDWAEGGWDLAQTIAFVKELKKIGIDFIDTSTGGLVSNAKIPVGPGFQVPFASAIRKEARIMSGAVGLITEAKQAEAILQEGHADAVLLARKFLRDPYFPLHAAQELGVEVKWPNQYERGR